MLTFLKFIFNITRPICALDRRTILCLYVPGFHGQVFKHVKILSERSKKMKEQKKNKWSVLVAESAYNIQNAQFGLVMNTEIVTKNKTCIDAGVDLGFSLGGGGIFKNEFENFVDLFLVD